MYTIHIVRPSWLCYPTNLCNIEEHEEGTDKHELGETAVVVDDTHEQHHAGQLVHHAQQVTFWQHRMVEYRDNGDIGQIAVVVDGNYQQQHNAGQLELNVRQVMLW